MKKSKVPTERYREEVAHPKSVGKRPTECYREGSVTEPYGEEMPLPKSVGKSGARPKSAGKRPTVILKKMKEYSLFYQEVWKACARIPKGQARTYGWIAQKINRPNAARAVGQALAKNPFSPIIPCHRVVGSNGKLTGFSAAGGIKAKAALLKQEGWNGKI